MPRPLAASITVAAWWSSVSLPSTVILGMGLLTTRGDTSPRAPLYQRSYSLCRLPHGNAGRGGISGNRHHAALVVDVILEFAAEVLDEALHRQRRRIAQRADGAPGDVVGDVREKVEIFISSFAVLDPVHHPVQPPCAFAAGRALAAGFLEVKVRQALEGFDHAGGFIHDDHRPGPQHRAGLAIES